MFKLRNLPTNDQLIVALWRAMKALGGSGSIEEIYDKVVELEKLPEDVVAQPHDPGIITRPKSNMRTEKIEYVHVEDDWFDTV